jgi:hypothetical protein
LALDFGSRSIVHPEQRQQSVVAHAFAFTSASLRRRQHLILDQALLEVA